MNEKNSKPFFKNLLIAILYATIGVLLSIVAFLAFYIVSNKIAESKKVNPPFGIFTAVGESMEPTIEKYDVLLIAKKDMDTLEVGDIITFYQSDNIFKNVTVTHRIKEIIKENNSIKFITKGDSNKTQDAYIVTSSDILGKVVLIVPKLGLIQNYIAEHGPWIFLLFIPSIVFVIAITIRGIKLMKLKKERDNISEF